jgi:hypothetical protein
MGRQTAFFARAADDTSLWKYATEELSAVGLLNTYPEGERIAPLEAPPPLGQPGSHTVWICPSGYLGEVSTLPLPNRTVLIDPVVSPVIEWGRMGEEESRLFGGRIWIDGRVYAAHEPARTLYDRIRNWIRRTGVPTHLQGYWALPGAVQWYLEGKQLNHPQTASGVGITARIEEREIKKMIKSGRIRQQAQ